MLTSRLSVIAIVGAFIAGAFVASPELRAFAANTVGSADIIDESILSVDIKNGEVKNPDLGVGSVSSGSILDGAITTWDIKDSAITGADIANKAVKFSDQGFIVMFMYADDSTGNSKGWNPNGQATSFAIAENNGVYPNLAKSNVQITLDHSGPTTCAVYDTQDDLATTPIKDAIRINCNVAPSNGTVLKVLIASPFG